MFGGYQVTTTISKGTKKLEPSGFGNTSAQQTADASAQRAETQQTVNRQINESKAQTANEPAQQSQSAASSQREIKCPFCASHVKKKDVSGGRKELKIPFTNPPYRIPIPPFIAKLLSPDPEKCSCKGEQKIKDASDDTSKYEQAKQKAEANIEKTLDTEAKLGTGGSRTTIVQASDTLCVGLGFNRNASYEVIPEGNVAPGKMSADPETGAAFAAGIKTNAVVGKQTSLGWPSAMGNYTIKCANSFRLVTGGAGIQMTTKGPVNISGGITTITGPQVTVGSSSGPLTLEGDVVSISGKTISLTPTDANVFVKGTISATGNVAIGGQMHAETLSFCKATCPGKEERSTTEAANPDTTQTFPASWGGIGVKGITSSVMDLQIYFANIISEFETAAINLLAPTQMLNLTNRMGTLSKQLMPIEPLPTGIIMSGTCNVVGTGNLGFPVTSTNPLPIPIYNFPHTHGLPSLNHSHATMVPDIDYKDYSSPQAVRAKVINDSLVSNAPVVPTTKIQELLQYALRLPGFIANTGIQIQKAIQWVQQTLS